MLGAGGGSTSLKEFSWEGGGVGGVVIRLVGLREKGDWHRRKKSPDLNSPGGIISARPCPPVCGKSKMPPPPKSFVSHDFTNSHRKLFGFLFEMSIVSDVFNSLCLQRSDNEDLTSTSDDDPWWSAFSSVCNKMLVTYVLGSSSCYSVYWCPC